MLAAALAGVAVSAGAPEFDLTSTFYEIVPMANTTCHNGVDQDVESA
jgi:hypothetical protein